MIFGRLEPRKPSSPDLTDQAWALMAPYVPTAKPGGRPAHYPLRDILEAIFAMRRSGCAWRLRPQALPPWPRVYPYGWRKGGTWQVRHDLRRGLDRPKQLKRRPRHRLVDTFGGLLTVGVTAAPVQDRDGAMSLLAILRQRLSRLRVI